MASRRQKSMDLTPKMIFPRLGTWLEMFIAYSCSIYLKTKKIICGDLKIHYVECCKIVKNGLRTSKIDGFDPEKDFSQTSPWLEMFIAYSCTIYLKTKKIICGDLKIH